MKTAKSRKKDGREETTKVEFPCSLMSKLGVVASLTRERRPEVFKRLFEPVLDAEIKRLVPRNGSKPR